MGYAKPKCGLSRPTPFATGAGGAGGADGGNGSIKVITAQRVPDPVND